VTDDWIERQLRRVQEDYRKLPPWQQTARSNGSAGSRGETPREDAERSQPTPPPREQKQPSR
jgi:hypothetical protein